MIRIVTQKLDSNKLITYCLFESSCILHTYVPRSIIKTQKFSYLTFKELLIKGIFSTFEEFGCAMFYIFMLYLIFLIHIK